MRRAAVRSLVPLCSLTSLLLACTGPLEAECIELAEQPAMPEPALPSWSHQPDAAPPPVDPAGQPHLELVLEPAHDMHPNSVCNYVVEPRGFPAIDVAGTTLIDVDAHVDSNSDGEDEYMLLSRFTPGQAPREQLVYDRGDDFDYDATAGTTTSHCDAALERLREDVDAINTELAGTTWRGLERLDVVGIDAYEGHGQAWAARIEALPPDQRPVEILYRDDHFIARVRKVEVLAEIERPQWQGRQPLCSRMPKMTGVAVDRASGLALVEFDHYDGACMCPMHEYVDLVQLPNALLAEVDRRPTSVLPPSPEDAH